MHIANPLTLPFYLLPFYLLREGTDLEEGNSHFSYWEEVLYIANTLTLPFYLASISELCKYKWVSYEYPKLHILILNQ